VQKVPDSWVADAIQQENPLVYSTRPLVCQENPAFSVSRGKRPDRQPLIWQKNPKLVGSPATT